MSHFNFVILDLYLKTKAHDRETSNEIMDL